MLINAIILFVLEKSGEIALELVLIKLWKWVLSTSHYNHLHKSLKRQMTLIHLCWLLHQSRIKSSLEQKTLEEESNQQENPGE